MTECERIIKEGILPEDFFKEEVICDFVVDEKRKKIWAVLLDLLLKFDAVCKKHNLRYFFSGGTLLGLVRHKGFIPWDDDMDFNMPREDYEKLMKIGPDEFSDPYFFQTPYTDPEYYFSFAKLRNSNTTQISGAFRYAGFNQGIGIDIFPLDKCVLEDCEDNFNKIIELVMQNSMYMRKTNPFLTEKDKERMKRYPCENPLANYEKIQQIASQYQNQDTGYVGVPVWCGEQWQRATYEKDVYQDIIIEDFYGIAVPIPSGYEKKLITQYGDYMQLPPIEKRGVDHGDAIFEPDVPYKEYLQKIYESEGTV